MKKQDRILMRMIAEDVCPGRNPLTSSLRKTIRYLLLAGAALTAIFTLACPQPPYVTNLNAIIAQELGRNRHPVYGYRCTAGAHRGASVAHRENTLAALRAADNDNRYAFIEFDVQFSKDHRIVVYHDKRLLRLFGSMKAIRDATFAELAELTGGEIAAYDEVMDLLTKKVNIEIKSQGNPLEDRRLADALIADIKSRGRAGDVLISSISGEVISYINDTYPAVPTGRIYWLTSSTYLPFDSLTEGLYGELSAGRADFLMLHVANLRNIEDLLKFKPRDKTIVFWDFDDSMYLVHKDLGDRLWGDSIFPALARHLRYAFLSIFPPRESPGMPASRPARTITA
jgi:glycerophosphoryl diester phosphodiesterase